jgi:hypothetical protein
VQGDYECIGVDDALRAVTLGAACTLKLDNESVRSNRQAGPRSARAGPEVAPSALQDVPV